MGSATNPEKSTFNNEPEIIDDSISLEAFDTPIPLVIPPDSSRKLKLRNCGLNEVELKLSVLTSDSTDFDVEFQIKPDEAVVKPNDILTIELTYSPCEIKFDPSSVDDSKQKESKGRSKRKINDISNMAKRHALIEVTVGEKDCVYMYPLLGSDDPEDEKIAVEKHNNYSKKNIISEEDDDDECSEEFDENEEFEEEISPRIRTSKRKRSPAKKPKLTSRINKRKPDIIEGKNKQSILPDVVQNNNSNSSSNVKVKEETIKEEPEPENEIDIKDEPIDLLS